MIQYDTSLYLYTMDGLVFHLNLQKDPLFMVKEGFINEDENPVFMMLSHSFLGPSL